MTVKLSESERMSLDTFMDGIAVVAKSMGTEVYDSGDVILVMSGDRIMGLRFCGRWADIETKITVSNDAQRNEMGDAFLERLRGGDE
jgi:hypothetical protein